MGLGKQSPPVFNLAMSKAVSLFSVKLHSDTLGQWAHELLRPRPTEIRAQPKGHSQHERSCENLPTICLERKKQAGVLSRSAQWLPRSINQPWDLGVSALQARYAKKTKISRDLCKSNKKAAGVPIDRDKLNPETFTVRSLLYFFSTHKALGLARCKI